MAALLTALILFVTALAVHVAWWRIRLPRHHNAALLAVFAAVPTAAALFAWVADLRYGLAWADLPGVLLLYGTATGCYLITYAGVEETSPSLVIIRALEKAGPAGCTAEELGAHLTEDRFITPRIAALQRDRLVEPAGNGARLTPAGRRVALLARSLARLFNLDVGA